MESKSKFKSDFDCENCRNFLEKKTIDKYCKKCDKEIININKHLKEKHEEYTNFSSTSATFGIIHCNEFFNKKKKYYIIINSKIILNDCVFFNESGCGCSKSFTKVSGFGPHLIKHHNALELIKCPHENCIYQDPQRSNVITHMSRKNHKYSVAKKRKPKALNLEERKSESTKRMKIESEEKLLDEIKRNEVLDDETESEEKLLDKMKCNEVLDDESGLEVLECSNENLNDLIRFELDTTGEMFYAGENVGDNSFSNFDGQYRSKSHLKKLSKKHSKKKSKKKSKKRSKKHSKKRSKKHIKKRSKKNSKKKISKGHKSSKKRSKKRTVRNYKK